MRYLILILSVSVALAQPKRLPKGQLPTTTVYTDQANTWSTGIQDFSAATFFRAAIGTGAPSSGDCDGSGKVGRIYVRSNAAATFASLYVCANTGSSAYGWDLYTNSGGSSIDTLTGTGSGATAGVQIYNSTATTGVSLLNVRLGAANQSGGHPYGFSVYKNDGTTFIFGAGDLGPFVNGPLNFCDVTITYPCNHYQANSEGANNSIVESFTGNASHGAFNFELNNPATQTSGTAAYFWLDSNAGNGFAPTSGTAVWNGLWNHLTLNQTGGANGITRGIFIDSVLTAVADYRALEISNTGSTQTAILTGTGKIILGDLKTTGSAGSKKVVCVDTSTGQLYASSTGTDCSN